jgi:hypothetical protein
LHRLEHASFLGALTAYLLQQIQLLAHRDRHGLASWSATGNRSAEPTFQFGYDSLHSRTTFLCFYLDSLSVFFTQKGL